MTPCGHAACDKCIDSWMMNKTSFAQTLRNGNSVTSCPLCRANVEDTVALGPPTESIDDSNDAEVYDHQTLQALAKQRQEEIIQAAKEQRNGMANGTHTNGHAPSSTTTTATANGTSSTTASSAWGAAKTAAPAGLPPPQPKPPVISAAPGAATTTTTRKPTPSQPPRDLHAAFFGRGSEQQPQPQQQPAVVDPWLEDEKEEGGHRMLFGGGERASNTSDLGKAEMEARLAAMMDDDFGGDLPDDWEDVADAKPPASNGPPGLPPQGKPQGPSPPAVAPQPNGTKAGGVGEEGWAPVGGKKNKKNHGDWETEEEKRKREEAEETRKHAEWMKAQMEKEKAEKEAQRGRKGQNGSVANGPSPPPAERISSQAASEASTELQTNGRSTPSEREDSSPSSQSSVPSRPPGALGQVKPAISPSPSTDGWGQPPPKSSIEAAFGGFGGLPTGFGALSASASAFQPAPLGIPAAPPRESYSSSPGPPGALSQNGLANGTTSTAVSSTTSAPRATPAADAKAAELRNELGSLREQLAAKDAQLKAYGQAAARTSEAEDRAASLQSTVDRLTRELSQSQTLVTSLQKVANEGRAKDEQIRSLQVSLLADAIHNTALSPLAHTSLPSLLLPQAKHTQLTSQHEELQARCESMWRELEDKDKRVANLERQLATIDRAPPPPQNQGMPPPGQRRPPPFGGGPLPPGPGFAPPVPQQQQVRPPPPQQVLMRPGPPPGPTPMLPPGGRPQTAAAAVRPRAPAMWKCKHCTYENHSPPIFDPQTREQVGFCEVCQNPTPLRL